MGLKSETTDAYLIAGSGTKVKVGNPMSQQDHEDFTAIWKDCSHRKSSSFQNDKGQALVIPFYVDLLYTDDSILIGQSQNIALFYAPLQDRLRTDRGEISLDQALERPRT